MKKVLEWAIAASIFMVAAVCLGLVGPGSTDPASAIVIAGAVAVMFTFVALDHIFRGLLGNVAVVVVGIMFSSLLAVALSVLLLAFAAFDVARTLRIGLRGFGLASMAYLIEGAGIYATLRLGLWWPAAIAAAVLGIWWLAVWFAEKKLRLASV